jgi:HsdM N-terminal domain
MARPKTEKRANGGANLGFEQTLWQAADKLRGHMDAAEYKHVVLGLIFLKYISDAFEEQHAKLASEKGADPEDRDEYVAVSSRQTRESDSDRSPTSRTPLRRLGLLNGSRRLISGGSPTSLGLWIRFITSWRDCWNASNRWRLPCSSRPRARRHRSAGQRRSFYPMDV